MSYTPHRYSTQKRLQEHKESRKKAASLPLFRLFLIILTFFLIIFSLNIYNPSLVPGQLRVISLNKKKNILVLGCDEILSKTEEHGQKIWKGRSDTIAIVGCDAEKNTLNILNIPRDTKIRVPHFGLQKMNFLNSIAGPIFTKRALEKMLKIKIDSYVIVNVKGLNEIIDEVGGITIDVPQRMQYKDYSGMLFIDLVPGKQVLNGDQALGFVRFRHDALGDIGRIQRQQAFIRAAINKLWDPVTFTKLPQLGSMYEKTILTNMKTKELIKVANFARNVPKKNQSIVMLPGEFGSEDGVSYWVADQEQTRSIVRRLFYGEKIIENDEPIKIAILNASKKDNLLATKLSHRLRQYDHSIMYTQDHKSYLKTTKIYAQNGNYETALKVKKNLRNIGEIIVGNFGPPDTDVTILAGDDLVDFINKEGN
jgi:LCP family protein required for cell wall assembly